MVREHACPRDRYTPLYDPPRSLVPCTLILLSLLVLWGCGPAIKVPPLTLTDVARMEATANDLQGSYRIEPGDTLQIRYTFHPEMNQEEAVRPDGKITATMVGELTVAGMTPSELAQLLVKKTSHRLRDPEVVVEISHFGERSIYVGGEVGRPGSVPYRKGLSPLQAIIAAGGFRDTARLDSVILVRTTGIENEFLSRKLNLEDVLIGGAREPITLAARDVLFVPRTRIANANLWVRQHITDLIPFLRGSVGANARVQ